MSQDAAWVACPLEVGKRGSWGRKGYGYPVPWLKVSANTRRGVNSNFVNVSVYAP